MGGAERVVHVDIAEGREGARELGIVLFFARPEARVLDERDAAARQASRGGNAGRGIGDELDGRAQQLLQVAHDLFERELRIGSPPGLGAAEVRQQNHPRAFLTQVLDRWQRRAQPRVVGDLSVLQRNVEVDPH